MACVAPAVHVPPDSATIWRRAASQACSESSRTPSRSNTTAFSSPLGGIQLPDLGRAERPPVCPKLIDRADERAADRERARRRGDAGRVLDLLRDAVDVDADRLRGGVVDAGHLMPAAGARAEATVVVVQVGA